MQYGLFCLGSVVEREIRLGNRRGEKNQECILHILYVFFKVLKTGSLF